MKGQKRSLTGKLALFAVSALLMAPIANAREVNLGDDATALTIRDAVQVERDADELRDRVRPHDVDRDRVDTVVVFTNSRGHMSS